MGRATSGTVAPSAPVPAHAGLGPPAGPADEKDVAAEVDSRLRPRPPLLLPPLMLSAKRIAGVFRGVVACLWEVVVPAPSPGEWENKERGSSATVDPRLLDGVRLEEDNKVRVRRLSLPPSSKYESSSASSLAWSAPVAVDAAGAADAAMTSSSSDRGSLSPLTRGRQCLK
jgi:hypothetical protein